MAFKLPENVQETSTTTGTVTLTLAGAVSGAYSFSSQLSNGDETFYVMTDSVDIEVGKGTYTNTSGQQLSRDTVYYSTNGNARVDWGVGTRDVFVGLPGYVLASLLNPAAAAGILVRTADHTYTARQIDVDPDDLLVANANAAAGNPTLSLAFTVSTFIKTLLDDANAAAARTTLGLGTAATQDTGTSGGTVPLLNAENIWSALQNHSAIVVGSPAGGSQGPGTVNAIGLYINGTDVAIATVTNTNVRNANASSAAGAVGTYAELRQITGAARVVGYQTAGSNLLYSNGDGATGGGSPSGSWRLMGALPGTSDSSSSLWLRYA